MRLIVIGYPADMGGANTELWHTIRLWRRFGVDVTVVPTWTDDPAWRARVEGVGCKILTGRPDTLDVPPGSTVVSLGNHRLLQMADRLHGLGCRLIYMPCMSEPTDFDYKFHDAGGLCDEYVFQSRYQRGRFIHLLPTLGVDCPIIPGAFDPSDFPFRPPPHKPGEPFVCGRISRPDPLKFSPDLWDAYRGVPNIRARIMGWSAAVEEHCGKPPEWATVLRKRSEPARAFYGKLHAIIHPGGEAAENWPRFVLEAMAAGVPVITDDRGGTREMIEDGVTGFLCDSPSDMAVHAGILEQDEAGRIGMARDARAAVERLSDPEAIWAKWEPLIGGC